MIIIIIIYIVMFTASFAGHSVEVLDTYVFVESIDAVTVKQGNLI